MKRPTFFLSSTIYDFSDLRSAIKHFLEQQGCSVLASEFNDFRKPLDKHSYQACLDAISQADYFILLIGTRVGGWYDKNNNVSITQREYREAYDLCEKKQIKIITFVRSDIWNLRSDRIELKNHLESLDINENEKESIISFPTKRANDAEFISNFINEVGRNQDTKNALNGQGAFPSGNWIHIFSSFRDIVDVLSIEIFKGLQIDESVNRRLLLGELKEILRKCLPKIKAGTIISPAIHIKNLYSEHKIHQDLIKEKRISINTNRWNILSSVSIHLMGLSLLEPIILPQVLSSSVFLTFNTDLETFVEQPIYKALQQLYTEVRLLSKSNSSERLSIVFENSPARRPNIGSEIDLSSLDFLALLHLLQRWSNVIELTKACIKFLEGHEFIYPDLFGQSPIVEMNKELEKELATDEELNNFIYKKN